MTLSTSIGLCSELILCFMLEFDLKPGIVTVVVNASADSLPRVMVTTAGCECYLPGMLEPNVGLGERTASLAPPLTGYSHRVVN